MERGSVQHGARLDDELAEGTEGLTMGAPVSARERDDLDPEAPTSDELDLTAVRPDLDAIAPGQFIARSELARWLLPSTFPGDAAALLADARSLAAPEDVVVLLEQLDPSAHFEAFGEVWRALGGTVETRSETRDVEEDGPEPPLDDRAEELAEAVADAVEKGIDAPSPAPVVPEPVPVVDVSDGRDLVATAVGIALTPVRVVFAVVREVVRVGSRVVHDR